MRMINLREPFYIHLYYRSVMDSDSGIFRGDFLMTLTVAVMRQNTVTEKTKGWNKLSDEQIRVYSEILRKFLLEVLNKDMTNMLVTRQVYLDKNLTVNEQVCNFIYFREFLNSIKNPIIM